MGKRARAAGITGAMLRGQRTKRAERDEEAHQLASAVYAEAIAWRGQGGTINVAPAAVSCSLAAPGLTKLMGLQADSVPEVAAFLVARFLQMLGEVGREDFDTWIAAMKVEGAPPG